LPEDIDEMLEPLIRTAVDRRGENTRGILFWSDVPRLKERVWCKGYIVGIVGDVK
jgi:hypothetical protein